MTTHDQQRALILSIKQEHLHFFYRQETRQVYLLSNTEESHSALQRVTTDTEEENLSRFLENEASIEEP